MEIEGYDFINQKYRNCSYISCEKSASFGYKDTTKRLCCYQHRLENMISLVDKNRLCKCNVRPSYGYPGDKKPQCCVNCKTDNMINIISPLCKCGSGTQPIFGYIDDLTPKCCSQCKDNDMIDIRSKKCKCGKHQPVYGFLNDIVASCCNKCKELTMVNIKANKCKCGKSQPCFGYLSDKNPLYCYDCRIDGMTNLYKTKCICNKTAIFGYLYDDKPSCCKICMNFDMIDITHKKCISENCSTRINPKYKPYCAQCFRKLFPNHEFTKIYKVKERCIVDFIDQYFKEYNPVYDKRIKGGSSFRRPDIYIDCITHIVIIEIDEDQHKDYDSDDETNRSMQILEDLSNRVTIFIRFNPDNYTDKDGNKIKSCFEYNNDQKKLIISDQDALDNRLNTLRNCIEKHIKNTPDKTIDIINLYYDGF